jgi:phosphoserine phosphatase RsbU/P
LEHGDLLLLYTDGITEARAPLTGKGPQELFGLERLDKLLLDSNGSAPQQCINRVRAELAVFCNSAPLADDQTLIAIHCV